MTERGRQILYAILIALGCLVALVVAVVISFVSWVSRPGELIEPERLMSADSTGYAQWNLRLEDPGTEGFLRLLLQATRELPPDVEDSLPPFVDGWIQGRREADALGGIRRFLPGLAAWSLRPAMNDSSHDMHLVSVSAQGLGNQLVLADWVGPFVIARSPNGSVHPYKGENIYQLGIPERGVEATFFARRGAIFATSDVEMAREAIDLLALEEKNQDRPPTGLEKLFATTRGTEPLRAAVTNGHSELPHVWTSLGGDAIDGVNDWRDVQGATVVGGLQADGSFHGAVELMTGTATAREAAASAFAQALTQRLQHLALVPEVQATTLTDRIRIEIHVPDLVESLAARLRERRPTP